MTVKQRQMQQMRLRETASVPAKAMILCAGKGTRMMPLTRDMPKAMVEVAGEPMLARALERCAEAGVKDVVLNAHYKPAALDAFVEAWDGAPTLHMSREEDALLETGGGIQKALALLGEDPFLAINCDVVWRNGLNDGLTHLARHWDDARMDVLLMLMPMAHAVGIGDRGDFHFASDGQVTWPKERKVSAYAYAGVQILHPRAFIEAPGGAYSVRKIWNTAMEAGRVYGCLHEGPWAHVGTPEGVAQAEAMLGYSRRA